MEKRIHTLRKEDVLREEFKKVGLNEILSNINIGVDPSDSPYELERKFRSAVKRQVKKHMESMSIEDIILFIKESSVGPYKVEVELLPLPSTEKEETIIELLRLGGKIKGDFHDKYYPIQMKIINFNQETEVYSLLKKGLLDKYHLRQWGMKKNSKRLGYFTFADIYRTVSNVIVNNTLVAFASEQREFVQFKIAEYYALRSQNEGVQVIPPLDSLFQQYIRLSIKKYNLPSLIVEKNKVMYDNTFKLEDFQGSIVTRESMPNKIKHIILPRLIRTMSYIREKTQRIMDEHSSYAKVFQLKKNINSSTMAIMKDNQFLSMYGEVELDNQVDISKFRDLEIEFKFLFNKLNLGKALDHSFRIRKLGRHKAAGIYYPYYKSTIIDLDGPDAYAHELGHQLDHTLVQNDVQSESFKFFPVISMYERLVEDSISKLPDDDAFRLIWNGATKFNRSYYLQPTEIFARSFELYLSKTKHISSSFLKENYHSPVYPLNQDFLKLIESYFNNLFANCEIKEEIAQ